MPEADPIEPKQKIAKAVKRGFFTTVDLFAGCGGMTLGFHRAGFRCISAIERDADAAESHALNFSGRTCDYGYTRFSDVTQTAPAEAVEHARGFFSATENIVDVVIGGPPCQAFSRLGRAALWRIAGADGAHAHDERATMYHYYLAYIDALRPVAFVMENVREIGKFANTNLAEEIASTADRLGYECRYTLLNAVWYGVPQLRERAFMIGIRKELGIVPQFPNITHRYDLPVGYSTARAGTGRVEFLQPHDHYVDHLKFSRKKRPAVTVGEAFADLPPIRSHLSELSATKKPRDPNERTAYFETENEFTAEMRSWPDFRNPNGAFTGHIIRNTPRDYETFRRMPEGGMYPEALATAEAIFRERLARLEEPHLANRTTAQERVSFHIAESYAPNESLVHYGALRLQETDIYGASFRALPPAEHMVLVAWYRDTQQLEWTRAKQIAIVRLGRRPGAWHVQPEFAEARHLLLHSRAGVSPRGLWRLRSPGYRVLTDAELKGTGYPGLASGEIYALFEIEADPNWATVEWDRKKLIRAIREFESRIRYKLVKNIGRRSAFPRILPLRDLLTVRLSS